MAGKSSIGSVLVLGPAPGGQGGISTCMAVLERHYPQDALNLEFVNPGSSGDRRVLRFLVAYVQILWHGRQGRWATAHINLSSGGSAMRKCLLAIAVRRSRLPYVVHLHSGRFPEFYSSTPRVMRWAVRRMFAEADSVLVLGESTRRFLISAQIVAPSRLVVVPNASEDVLGSPYRPEDSRPTILFAGRLGPRKGVPELIRALASMKDLDFKATLAGNGDVAGAMELAKAVGSANCLSFPGWLSASDLREYMRPGAIFVLPSHSEGLPIALLEAMSASMAIVATPVGGIPETATNRHDALLIRPGDITGLATALRRLVQDEALRLTLGANARATWESRFQPDKWAAVVARHHTRSLRPTNPSAS